MCVFHNHGAVVGRILRVVQASALDGKKKTKTKRRRRRTSASQRHSVTLFLNNGSRRRSTSPGTRQTPADGAAFKNSNVSADACKFTDSPVLMTSSNSTAAPLPRPIHTVQEIKNGRALVMRMSGQTRSWCKLCNNAA